MLVKRWGNLSAVMKVANLVVELADAKVAMKVYAMDALKVERRAASSDGKKEYPSDWK
jgi:hypothetical protein